MAIRDWPEVLRAGGVPAVVLDSTRRLSLGSMRDLNVLLHHDASPAGDSPGALAYLVSNFQRASAQIWVDRAGTWHFVSFGMAPHAGVVHEWAARWSNPFAAGIETDHTIGETWPARQLLGLRRGLALILAHEGKSVADVQFHKHVAAPAGRKPDPDGLDLDTERQEIAAFMTGDDMPGPSVNDILMGPVTVTYRYATKPDQWTTETHPLAKWIALMFNNQLDILRGLDQLGADVEEATVPRRVLFMLADDPEPGTVYLAKLDQQTWSPIPYDKANDVRRALDQLDQPYIDYTDDAPVTGPYIYGALVEWDGSV